MCVVLICPEKVRPSLDTLRLCENENPHGGGVAWRRNGAVEWIKTNSVEEIHDIGKKSKGEIVVHFRIASIGGVCNELRHPFPVTHRVSLDDKGKTNAVLFQNGTWGGYQEALTFAASEGHEAPAGPMSDTRAAAFLCSIYGHKFLKKLPSRWVYFSARETAMFGDWYKRKGIYYSNLYWDRKPMREVIQQPQRYKTKIEQELELWDMQTTDSYWDTVQRGCPKPKRGEA